MKGQSTIEYLTSYGWMLVTVAVVSGALYSQIGDASCVQSTSAFEFQSFRIDNFGLTSSGDLAFELTNSGSDQVNINNVTLSDDDLTASYNLSTLIIDPYNSDTFDIPGFESSEQCNDFEFQINYSSGGIEDQVASGDLTSQIKFEEDVFDLDRPVNLSAEYTD